MVKTLKLFLCVLFFAFLAVPTLYFLGAKEDFVKLAGWEKKIDIPACCVSNLMSRAFQSAFTENYAKNFFLRKTFLCTSYQLRDWANFGLFHAGYNGSIVEGKKGVLYERPYSSFHLSCPRPAGKAKYASVLKLLKEVDAYCTSNGVDFVYILMPDKQQLYPEFLPSWYDWFWDYSNYDVQGELAALCRAEGIKVYDAYRYLIDRKPDWQVCVYPPVGDHLNAYGSGLVYGGFLKEYAKMGSHKLRANPFCGVRPIVPCWLVDDDIGNLLNLWYNPRMKTNPHYEPVFETTNVTMNAGSVILFGDCFREQVARIFQDARLFDPKKVILSERHNLQKPEGFRPFVKDLKIFGMVYQSFNSGRLDQQEKEIRHVFTTLKASRATSSARSGNDCK